MSGLLGGLARPVRDTAIVAAVLGEDDLDPDLLAEVTDQAADAVSEHLLALALAGMLTMTGNAPVRYRFAHSLIRDGIARQSGPSVAVLHRRAAAALERSVGTNPAQAIQECAEFLVPKFLGVRLEAFGLFSTALQRL